MGQQERLFPRTSLQTILSPVLLASSSSATSHQQWQEKKRRPRRHYRDRHTSETVWSCNIQYNNMDLDGSHPVPAVNQCLEHYIFINTQTRVLCPAYNVQSWPQTLSQAGRHHVISNPLSHESPYCQSLTTVGESHNIKPPLYVVEAHRQSLTVELNI